MKRIVGVAIAFALSLCMFGCAVGDSSNDALKKDEPNAANVGEPVMVTGNWGDLEITVESFEDNTKVTADMLRYGNISEEQHIGLIKMIVNNVSCDNGTDSHDFINLPSSFYVIGVDGVSLTAMDTAFDLDGYDGAAGATFNCAIGQSKRVAVFYPISADTDEVTVHAGDTTITVPVSVI